MADISLRAIPKYGSNIGSSPGSDKPPPLRLPRPYPLSICIGSSFPPSSKAKPLSSPLLSRAFPLPLLVDVPYSLDVLMASHSTRISPHSDRRIISALARAGPTKVWKSDEYASRSIPLCDRYRRGINVMVQQKRSKKLAAKIP